MGLAVRAKISNPLLSSYLLERIQAFLTLLVYLSPSPEKSFVIVGLGLGELP